MPKKTTARKIVGALKDADDLCHLLTGQRIHQIGARAFVLFGEDLKSAAAKKMLGEEPPVPEDSPYLVLGVRPDASDIVVRGSFRALAHAYHPDTGEHPDPKKFQEVNEAYKKILILRKSPG